MGALKAVDVISGNNSVKGTLQFIQQPNGSTHVSGRITGLAPGLHGFHIHALGDTTNGCNSTDQRNGAILFPLWGSFEIHSKRKHEGAIGGTYLLTSAS